MAKDNWGGRTRSSKLACVLYPAHVDEDTRRQMRELSANEMKKAPTASPLLADHKRGSVSPLGGTASVKRRNE